MEHPLCGLTPFAQDRPDRLGITETVYSSPEWPTIGPGPNTGLCAADQGKIFRMPAPLSLTDRQRRHLRGLAHTLKPVVRLGNAGMTEPVAQETARALEDHELIKVKAPGGDRHARDVLFAELSRRTGSMLVHRIGNVAVLYRPRRDLPKIVIPDE